MYKSTIILTIDYSYSKIPMAAKELWMFGANGNAAESRCVFNTVAAVGARKDALALIWRKAGGQDIFFKGAWRE